MTKRVKAGTSRAQAAERRKLFVEAYVTNGGNATQAAITAGFTQKSAAVRGSELVKDRNVAEAIEKRRSTALVAAQEVTDLTAAEVLASLARDIRFDPAKLYNDDGSLKAIKDLDEDTRLALRSVEVDEIKEGNGKERIVVGHTTKVKFPEKTAAREQGMKHFGMYERDNSQKPPAVLIHAPGAKTLTFEPLSGRRTADRTA
jgi:phage terminase small subunit